MRMNRQMCANLVGGLMLAVTLSAGAEQVYKWKDSGGTVHYSQQPPPAGVKASSVALSGSTGASVPVPPSPPESAKADEVQQADHRQRKHLCEVATHNIALLSQGAMVASGSDISSATQLNPEQRQQALKSAQADQGRYCHGK